MFEDVNVFHEQFLDSPNYQIMGTSAALIGKRQIGNSCNYDVYLERRILCSFRNQYDSIPPLYSMLAGFTRQAWEGHLTPKSSRHLI